VYPIPDNIKAVVWSGSYLYLARAIEGLLILDIGNPVAPVLVGEMDPYPTVTEITSLAVSGSHAYLGANNGNLSILDVSDPAQPQPAGLFDPPDWYDAPQEVTSVQVIGHIAYLGVTTPPPTPLAGFHTGRVFIVDVSDPEEPVELDIVHTGGGFDWVPMKIELNDSRMYIAYEREGLVIFNNSTPEQPAAIGTYDPSESITGVSVSGEEIYVYNKSAFILRYADTLTFKTFLPMIVSNP
jgi:hypothetical protein